MPLVLSMLVMSRFVAMFRIVVMHVSFRLCVCVLGRSWNVCALAATPHRVELCIQSHFILDYKD